MIVSGKGKRSYVKGIFSDIAPRYDLLNHLLSLNIDKGWRRKAIHRLGIARKPVGTYLDLCAGTLDVAAEIAKTRGFDGKVIAADFAEPMLRAGVHKLNSAHGNPVCADAVELPLKDSSVSGAIVAFGIRNVADLDAGLREAYRVIEPNGRFVILEFSTPDNSVVRSAYHTYFHHVLPVIGGIVSGHGTAYKYLPKSVANFPVREELAARMQSAGFTDVNWQPLTFGIAAIHTGTKR